MIKEDVLDNLTFDDQKLLNNELVLETMNENISFNLNLVHKRMIKKISTWSYLTFQLDKMDHPIKNIIHIGAESTIYFPYSRNDSIVYFEHAKPKFSDLIIFDSTFLIITKIIGHYPQSDENISYVLGARIAVNMTSSRKINILKEFYDWNESKNILLFNINKNHYFVLNKDNIDKIFSFLYFLYNKYNELFQDYCFDVVTKKKGIQLLKEN